MARPARSMIFVHRTNFRFFPRPINALLAQSRGREAHARKKRHYGERFHTISCKMWMTSPSFQSVQLEIILGCRPEGLDFGGKD